MSESETVTLEEKAALTLRCEARDCVLHTQALVSVAVKMINDALFDWTQQLDEGERLCTWMSAQADEYNCLSWEHDNWEVRVITEQTGSVFNASEVRYGGVLLAQFWLHGWTEEDGLPARMVVSVNGYFRTPESDDFFADHVGAIWPVPDDEELDLQ